MISPRHRFPGLFRRVASPLLALTLSACTGAVSEAPRPGEGSGPPSTPSQPNPAPVAGQVTVGASPVQRLSRFEYDNTVRDLLGDTTRPASAFPPDVLGPNGYYESVSVSQVDVERYGAAAETLARTAVTKLSTLLPCDPMAAGEGPCAQKFVQTFGKRAFRRPLEATELQDFEGLYTGARRAGADFAGGIRAVITGMLQAPQFLYRWELGGTASAGSKVVQLTPHEQASRLSYFLWRSMPDDRLLATADADGLRTPESVAAEARRLLGDPRARDTIALFTTQWLHLHPLETLSKDTNLYPAWNEALRRSMRAEVDAFVQHVILSGDGKLETLLTAPFSFVNGPLAQLYGLKSGPTGETLARAELPPTQRAGLLTLPAILAVNAIPSETSPILRGRMVREQLLCQPLPPPPANMNITPPKPDPNKTVRQRFSDHASNSACASCHRLIDPIGFGLETYDSIGRFRTMERNLPIDAAGDLTQAGDADGPFNGAVELAQRLARSSAVRSCVVQQWFRYATGRDEGPDDKASLDQMEKAFAASGHDLHALIIELTQTPAFRYRRLPEAKVSP